MKKIIVNSIFVSIIVVISFVALTRSAEEVKQEKAVVATPHVWSVADSRAYARDKMFELADKEFSCMNKLWIKESNWNPKAYNKVKVEGKNAGGIPQILGLDPELPAPMQIDRGIKYTLYRYDTFCNAWKHWQKHR